ncbi:MAG TPA: hypothetical protein DEF80_03045 [Pantoea sp.]|nr:hypothetical protein [Pantoea sp.]
MYYGDVNPEIFNLHSVHLSVTVTGCLAKTQPQALTYIGYWVTGQRVSTLSQRDRDHRFTVPSCLNRLSAGLIALMPL